jgi:hypothetical protein
MTTRFSRLFRPGADMSDWWPVVAGIAVLALLLVVGALEDPSGLLAPVGGRGVAWIGGGGAYRWAPALVDVPVLVAGIGGSILATVRTSGRRASRWTLFAITWVATIGTAALATAATGLVSVTGLLGAHLGVGEAIRFTLSTGGYAAIKFALLGPVIATAATIAYRKSKEVAETVVPADDRMPIAMAALVVAVLAMVASGAWWLGGPQGYAYHGFVIAPTTATDLGGWAAGFFVFLGVFWLGFRLVRRWLRSGTVIATAVAAWVAAVTAGIALGVVDALQSPWERINPSGPDSWWIATTLIGLASGIGYGATVGLITAPLVALVARSPIRIAGPHWGWIAAVAFLAPVVLIGGTPTPPPVVSETSTDPLPRLQLLPAASGSSLPTIGDVNGRQVLLRGVDVNQLIDYYLRDPAVPADGPLTDDDFARMASMGFNVVRLGMSWSRLEPQRGVFDQAYLGQVESAVASAKAHGIYTVLDMHEDAWGNALAAPDQACDGGTSPTTGFDGAPAWATITDGARHCQFMARDLAPAVAAAFGNFYTDRDGIQTELVRTWAFVASAFADEPAVAGYDLLNEPGIGANPPISSGLLLGRYYSAAIDAIRGAERAGHGFSHLAFFEPSVLWSGLGFDVTPPPGFTSDREIVFAPHPYSESITMDQSLGLTIASIERNLTVSARAASGYGAALWAGEWGWFGDPAVDGAKVARFTAEQDRLGIGGAFWVWRQGCGSPETDAAATKSGNLIGVDCATGTLLDPPPGYAQPLSRAYPRTFPGRLDSLVSAADVRDMTLSATSNRTGIACGLDIWVPGSATPNVTATGVADIATTPVSGGWRITGCATGAYRIAVR